MSRGLYIAKPTRNREQERAFARYNAVIRSENREIASGNHRRRACVEKILEACILGKEERARVWVTKLVSAGFSAEDGAVFERLPLPELEGHYRAQVAERNASGRKSRFALSESEGTERREIERWLDTIDAQQAEIDRLKAQVTELQAYCLTGQWLHANERKTT